MSITAFSFGEWLPDLPDLGNPGLTEALNVLPVPGGYVPFLPLNPSGATISAQVTGAYRAYTNGNGIPVAGTTSAGFLASTDNGASWHTLPATTATGTTTVPWRFAQFEGILLAARDATNLYYTTVNALSAFSTMVAVTSAPFARELAVVGQFVVLGNLGSGGAGGEAAVQWGPIGDPTGAWPTPSSATAIATQSGRQYLDANFGSVTGLHGGDQFGIIVQQMAMTRMTYVGGSVVFQFDRISEGLGALYSGSSIKFGRLVYFISRQGAFVTDGVTVEPIGENKVANYLNALFYTGTSVVRAGVDALKNLVYWGISTTSGAASSGYVDHLLVYHVLEKRFTHAIQSLNCFVESGPISYQPNSPGAQAFSTTNVMGFLNGSPGTATLQSGEVEPQPGGCALINGIKPVIASSGTAPSISVQVGSRDDQATSVSYSSTTAPTSRTGFADFRSDARYHRARVYITGNFDKAQGLEIDATPTGGM